MSEKRKGNWMHTYTGKKFYPLDPRSEDVDIIDIAHALSLICRYNGHTKRFYSVAEHSILMSRNIEYNYKFSALMHDAAEAYITDLIRPIKADIKGFQEVEDNIMSTIEEKYGFFADYPAVKQVDLDITGDEKEQAMIGDLDWYKVGKGLGVKLKFWNPKKAEKMFLKEFGKLYNSFTTN